MKDELRQFATKLHEHLKTSRYSTELTNQLEKLAASAFAISNMPGWGRPDRVEQTGVKSLSTLSIRPPADIDIPAPLPPKKK
jgi:hypothetical protein